MSKKPNYNVERLWQKLSDYLSPIDADNFFELLQVVKLWIEENKRALGANFTKERAALSLLMNGKAFQFPMSKPLAGKYLKSLALSPLYPPRSIEDMADSLETAVREFAVFTKWEDCPVCREGYLGYWIEPCTNRLVLSCPECWWQQDMNGQEWIEELPLLPASLTGYLQARHLRKCKPPDLTDTCLKTLT